MTWSISKRSSRVSQIQPPSQPVGFPARILPDPSQSRVLQRQGRSLTLDGTIQEALRSPSWIKKRYKTANVAGNQFSVLPREVRDLIWTFAVGGRVLHMYFNNYGTGPFININASLKVKVRACVPPTSADGGCGSCYRGHICVKNQHPSKLIDSVDILLTCRQM